MSHAVVVNADARCLPLPDGSVHCAITSPPYYGLRDYGTATWEGGSDGCDHGEAYRARRQAGRQSDVEGGVPGSLRDKPTTSCKCGARRVDRQLGLEATPQAYVAEMVRVFREVRRVLRDDGTLWLNIGDSYASNSGSREHGRTGMIRGGVDGHVRTEGNRMVGGTEVPPGLKPKDLIGIPWMLAFALRDDGWWLRSDIIWSKPNPMPESVTDRPTKSHEYVFLLTKSERYFWDQEAVREAHSMKPQRRPAGRPVDVTPRPGQPKQGWSTATRDEIGIDGNPAGRNIRSVWTIPTHAFPGAHFATFPPALVERCVKAGTSQEGCCPTCGAPWGRETEIERGGPTSRASRRPTPTGVAGNHNSMGRVAGSDTRGLPSSSVSTLGWRPTCPCPARDPVPCTVLDNFAGSGTTGAVATGLGRRFVGVELSSDYCRMAVRRINRPHASHKTARTEVHPLFAGLDS